MLMKWFTEPKEGETPIEVKKSEQGIIFLLYKEDYNNFLDYLLIQKEIFFKYINDIESKIDYSKKELNKLEKLINKGDFELIKDHSFNEIKYKYLNYEKNKVKLIEYNTQYNLLKLLDRQTTIIAIDNNLLLPLLNEYYTKITNEANKSKPKITKLKQLIDSIKQLDNIKDNNLTINKCFVKTL